MFSATERPAGSSAEEVTRRPLDICEMLPCMARPVRSRFFCADSELLFVMMARGVPMMSAPCSDSKGTFGTVGERHRPRAPSREDVEKRGPGGQVRESLPGPLTYNQVNVRRAPNLKGCFAFSSRASRSGPQASPVDPALAPAESGARPATATPGRAAGSPGRASTRRPAAGPAAPRNSCSRTRGRRRGCCRARSSSSARCS